MASRSLVRRNYLRKIEITLNSRFGVDRQFDFIKKMTRDSKTQAALDETVTKKITSINQRIYCEPYELQESYRLANKDLCD